MRRSAPKVRPSSRPVKPTVSGSALAAVLKSYQQRTIDRAHARDVLLKLGVAGNPADQLLRAFRPHEGKNAEASS